MASLLVAACALSFRAERSFELPIELEGSEHLLLDLPETGLSVRGTNEAGSGRLFGTWYALGGSKRLAEDATAEGQFDRLEDGPSVYLRSYIPLEQEGSMELELDLLRIPRDLDLSVRNAGGDVDVHAVWGYVDLELPWGEARVSGAREGVDVYTGRGAIEVRTDRNQEMSTAVRTVSLGGDVRVEQHTDGEVLAESAQGDVTVLLADDEDVDLYVYGALGVEVDTPQLQLRLPNGELRRTLQEGRISVWVIAHEGRARVATLPGN